MNEFETTIDTADIPAAIRFLARDDQVAGCFVTNKTIENLYLMAKKVYAVAPFFLTFGDRLLNRVPINLWLDINVAIDEWYVNQIKKYADSHLTLINLGVGCDTKVFRLQGHLTSLHRIFEVDFGDNIERRLGVFSEIPSQLERSIQMPCPLSAISCDLSDVRLLEEALLKRGACSDPAIIQIERVFLYLNPLETEKLLSMLARILPRGSVLLSDFINPAMYDLMEATMPEWSRMWKRPEKPFGILQSAGWALLSPPANDVRRLYKIGSVGCLTNALFGGTSISRFDTTTSEPMLLTFAATNL